MSYEASNWVAALGPHLRGRARDVLWAGANRANFRHGHLVMLGERTWAAEADVDRKHLRRILGRLVELGVFKREPGSGTTADRYWFTFCDPAGLPRRLTFEPEPAPFNADSHAHAKAATATLRRHIAAQGRPSAVGASDAPTSAAGDEALAGASATPSGGISGPQRGRLTPPKPITQQPPPSGGRVAGGESTDRGGPAGVPVAAQQEKATTMPPGPAGNGAGPARGLVAQRGQGRGGGPADRPLTVVLPGGAHDPPNHQGEGEPARDAAEPVAAGAERGPG